MPRQALAFVDSSDCILDGTLIVPTPYFGQEPRHLDFLCFHTHDPGMLHHVPRRCSSCSFFLETIRWLARVPGPELRCENEMMKVVLTSTE